MPFRSLPCFSGTRYLKPETQVQIITDISTPVSLVHPVVTIGTFDGVHLGHKAILSEVTTHAREKVAIQWWLPFIHTPESPSASRFIC